MWTAVCYHSSLWCFSFFSSSVLPSSGCGRNLLRCTVINGIFIRLRLWTSANALTTHCSFVWIPPLNVSLNVDHMCWIYNNCSLENLYISLYLYIYYIWTNNIICVVPVFVAHVCVCVVCVCLWNYVHYIICCSGDAHIAAIALGE